MLPSGDGSAHENNGNSNDGHRRISNDDAVAATQINEVEPLFRHLTDPLPDTKRAHTEKAGPSSETLSRSLSDVAPSKYLHNRSRRPPPRSRLRWMQPLERLSQSLSTSITEEPTFYCEMCLCNQRMSLGHVVSNCGHMFCVACLQGYLVCMVIDGTVEVRCPFLDPADVACKVIVPETDTRMLLSGLSEEILLKYERYRALMNQNCRLCPSCDTPHTGTPEQPLMKCSVCECSFCFHHSLAHDETEPCAEYERRMAKRDVVTKDMIKQTCKKCPGCGAQTYKMSGCNHMSCRCGTEWCWLCNSRIITSSEYPMHYDSRNLLSSCAGQQFSDGDDDGGSRWPYCSSRFGQILCRTIRLLLRVLCFPVVIVAYMVSTLVYLLGFLFVWPAFICSPSIRHAYLRPRHMIDWIMIKGFICALGCIMVLALGVPLLLLWFALAPIWVTLVLMARRIDCSEFRDLLCLPFYCLAMLVGDHDDD
eukprot:NODE_1074_length_1722_cov_93.554094_g950_i0.p1 GENE.NODE_1074_length_1722_cov_93.554094_g950_i0~~NODE_1074_length_1722_cov_93.554094_g950_i0.p1  ORF type:complete len:478 (-),score=44.74 NODE_1074_length_1722_cov_93.554094_g950_i0:222-1655(-)